MYIYVYFVKLFTSLTLLDELSKKGISGCGTLRENRLEKAPLSTKKSFITESCSAGNNRVIRWEDKKAVTCPINFAMKFTADRYIPNEDGYKHLKCLLLFTFMTNVWTKWTFSINVLLIIAAQFVKKMVLAGLFSSREKEECRLGVCHKGQNKAHSFFS